MRPRKDLVRGLDVLLTEREGWEFDPARAAEALAEHFAVRTLEGFGIGEGDAPAIGAAGALMRYLRELLPAGVPHLARPVVERPGGVMPHRRDDASQSRARGVAARRRCGRHAARRARSHADADGRAGARGNGCLAPLTDPAADQLAARRGRGARARRDRARGAAHRARRRARRGAPRGEGRRAARESPRPARARRLACAVAARGSGARRGCTLSGTLADDPGLVGFVRRPRCGDPALARGAAAGLDRRERDDRARRGCGAG